VALILIQWWRDYREAGYSAVNRAHRKLRRAMHDQVRAIRLGDVRRLVESLGWRVGSTAFVRAFGA